MSRLRDLEKRIERIEKELGLGGRDDGGPFIPGDFGPERSYPSQCPRCGGRNKNEVCMVVSCPLRTGITCGPGSQDTVNLEVKSSLSSEAREEAKKAAEQAVMEVAKRMNQDGGGIV